MLRSAAVSLIATRLGGRTDLADEILSELQLAQTVLERSVTLPWFLLTEDFVVVDTVALQPYRDLPSDFLRLHDDEPIYRVDLTASPVKYYRLDKGSSDVQLLNAQSESDASIPTRYSIIGRRIWWQPIPDIGYAMRMKYYAADLTLSASSDTENRWLKYAPLLLIGKAGLPMATALGNTNAVSLFTADVAAEDARLVRETTAYEEQGRERRMGEAP